MDDNCAGCRRLRPPARNRSVLARVRSRVGLWTTVAAALGSSWSAPLRAQEGGFVFVEVSVVRLDHGDVLEGQTVMKLI